MKVQGDKNPGAFSVEVYPPKPTLSLVRFYENVTEATQEGATVYDYDEYQLRVPRCEEDDVALHYQDWLKQAKSLEYSPEKTLEETAKVEGQLIMATKFFAASATTFTDEQALTIPDLFPTWEEVLAAGAELAANTFLTKDGIVYRVVQAVTPQEGQVPGGEGMLAVYRPAETSHAGTQDDPIPWVYGMDCHTGQYFRYNGHVYRAAADMIPCVWAPGTAGLWQWELVS